MATAEYHKGSFLLTWIKFNLSMDAKKYIHHIVWSEITYHFQTSTVQPLKFGKDK